MQVILAQPRGFCAGVVRAIDIVDRALIKYGAPVFVRHEIVHNKHVVDELRDKGAVFVESLDAVPSGAVTVFSAHGVSREVEAEAQQRQLQVIDATCPLVRKIHHQGRQYAASGRTVILIGHAGHAEVIGTMGQIPGKVILVQDVADIERLELAADAPLAYVTQTTLSVDDTRHIIAALHQRFTNIIGPHTQDICYATQSRQSAVRTLVQQVDVLLVVGASNSSNSTRLREIGTESGVPSYLIADGSALDPAWVQGAQIVGLTAGASAPESMVQDVLAKLRQLGPVELSIMDGQPERVAFRLPDEVADLQFATS